MCDRIEAALALPTGAVYTQSMGTVGAAMYTYTAEQMREYGMANRLAEREVWRQDAERYRWLRGAGAWESEIGMELLSEDPDSFDAAVDAAMAG
jgi:hypothetical protein